MMSSSTDAIIILDGSMVDGIQRYQCPYQHTTTVEQQQTQNHHFCNWKYVIDEIR